MANGNNLNGLQGIASVSDAGQAAYNEDTLYIGPDLAFVLDGATGLGEPLIAEEGSDACWFVSRLSDLLCEAWSTQLTLDDALSDALAKVSAEWRASVSPSLPGYQVPSAAMALVAQEADELVLARLGDCELYVNDGVDTWRVFGDNALHRLDQRALDRFKQLQRQGEPPEKALQAIKPMLIAHREQMNAANGYSALSVVGLERIKPEVRRLKRSSVKRVLLTSDGFSAAWQAYGFDAPEFWLMREDPAAQLAFVLQQLRTCETLDADTVRFPRFKRHDDATAVIIDIVPVDET